MNKKITVLHNQIENSIYMLLVVISLNILYTRSPVGKH